MEFFLRHKEDIAILLARLVLGALFFLQGYDKVFRLGLKATGDSVENAMHQTGLPAGFVRGITVISSLAELICGLLLLAGLFVYPALTILGLDILLVVFAMGLREPLWDMRYVWPRLILILLLFFVHESYDHFSLDYFLFGNEAIPAVSIR